jgi:hypothetical protein
MLVLPAQEITLAEFAGHNHSEGKLYQDLNPGIKLERMTNGNE